MYSTETQLRVRYSETDKMGYSYYGNYAAYFEVARVEALRQLGLIYRELEDSGIILPVLEYSVKFYKPAYYDDLLIIKTTIPTLPTVRLPFEFETKNEQQQILNHAKVTLVFVDKTSGKPCQPPTQFMEKIQPYFK